MRRRRVGAVVAAVGTAGSLAAAAWAAPAPPDAARWRTYFQNRCGTCHTLADAKTHGRVGPNLDRLHPALAPAVAQITHGSPGGGLGAMPRFGQELTRTQIRALARYVVWATHAR